MIQNMTNLYSLSKTLQFSLIPIGKTEEFFNQRVLEEDVKRDADYPKMKAIMDRYHKVFIEETMSHLVLSNELLHEYYALYCKQSKSEEEAKRLEEIGEALRKQIGQAFKNRKEYSSILKPGDFIKNLIKPPYVAPEEKDIYDRFVNFATYFVGFSQNRENMYSEEDKATSVAHRCISENLPKFLDNMNVFRNKVLPNIDAENIDSLDEDMKAFSMFSVEDRFSVDYFTYVLSQSGIDDYNRVIGGYTTPDGTKVKGLNEYINLYNQQVTKALEGDKKKAKIPTLKPLYKQILSDRESVSFIPESFSCDQELLDSVSAFYSGNETESEGVEAVIGKAEQLISALREFNLQGIMISNDASLTSISQKVYEDWSFIETKWAEEYDRNQGSKSRNEKYFETRKKAYKNIKKFSIAQIQDLCGDEKVSAWLSDEFKGLCTNARECYEFASSLISEEYKSEQKLRYNNAATSKIKALLDSVKEIEWFLKALYATGEDGAIDDEFYGAFDEIYNAILPINRLYDKVRNYVTAKPYSKDKIKLNFNNPQFLGGWSQSKETDYLGVILLKDNQYFLAIMDNKKDSKKVFEKYQDNCAGPYYRKMNYNLLPGANKMLPKVFFSKSHIGEYAPSQEILRIRSTESFKKGKTFSLEDCHKFIDFYKESIEKHPEWGKFGFQFSDTKSYQDISGFFREVEAQGFSMSYTNISESYIDAAVENGDLYLFQIYCKDFSPFSKGTPNLHTLFFTQMFSEENMNNVVFRLNGEAEMFYRKASISDEEKTVHPANQPIKNKNVLNPKTESQFEYDLIKDKRFTKRQFSIHIPMTLNFHAQGESRINSLVKKAIHNGTSPYIIGIDRGERNLIYITVIDEAGKIVEQKSLNEIISVYHSQNGDVVNRTDYRGLLETREKERQKARQEWSSIENIKELKEGYISQVVNEICKLVVKYDAIVALEDLNGGFKNSRKKVERQVYDKFETMLYTKLRYLADKKLPPSDLGGVSKAYQLTCSEHKNNMLQDGVIFYIPAWLTSKIDPVTGFVNLLHPKYTSEPAARDFISAISDIRFNQAENLFEFDVDYRNFERTDADYRKTWTLCSYGERINNFRDKQKNNEWSYECVSVTEKFKDLFESYQINLNGNLKQQILNQSGKAFYASFMHLFSLMVQMRNSVPNSTKAEDDYLISPVKDTNGHFYDSRNVQDDLPKDADANGAYNIARKAKWIVEQLQMASDDSYEKTKFAISRAQWLEYCQK